MNTRTMNARVAHLRPRMAAEMIAHASEAAPREACGLIVYDRSLRPVELHRTRNVEPGPGAFEVDPVEHFAILRSTEERGRRIGAVYHSHPDGPARPSETDLAAGIDPEWISFIIGVGRTKEWVIRAFRMRDGRAEPLSIEWPNTRRQYPARRPNATKMAI